MAPELHPAETLAAGVAARMRLSPDAVAVVDGARQLSYAELDQVAGRIAGRLAEIGAGPGRAVAVCLPRSWQLVALMLGALRTGATVVPIDGASPAARIGFMLADAGCTLLVHAAGRDGWDLPSGCRAFAVETLLEEGAPAAPDLPPRSGDEVSFLFYTSGTTGQPKGVEVTDAGILRLAADPGFIDIRTGDRFACLSNPAFDALSFEIWVPLLTGGTCVVIPDSDLQDPPALAARLVAERIDTLFMTVSLFNAIVDQHPRCFAAARQVLIGGEQLNARAVRRWYDANPNRAGRIFNVYGPTECTTFALSHPIPPEFDGAVVPIGTVLPRTGALLVADGTRLAAPGETAELYLSGDGVARGYRNRPQETAERFVRLPWLDGGRDRHYRTGDLVRRTEDGLIEYVGRADRQVKVRGFRIEPGEVEQKILQHPAVGQAHVCTRRDEAGSHELLAYLVPQGALDHDEFDRHLKASLPPYMRPHRLYRVDRLPLTRNGKVDQEQLVRQAGAPWRRSSVAAGAGGPWQPRILDLAGRLLGVPDLGPEDDFVGSGGDSLKALRFRFELQRQWQRDLPAAAIMAEPFAALADRLSGPQPAAYPPLPEPVVGNRAAATAEQQRLAFLQQRDPASTAYAVPFVLHLHGAVDGRALARAFQLLVDRHAGLRTSFQPGPEGLEQVVAETVPAVCRLHPMGEAGDWQAVADTVFAEPFDLAAPTLFRAHWLPLSPDHGVLLLHMHHIVIDGWSLNLVFRDLAVCYAAETGQGAAALPPAGPAPLDVGRWQAQWFAQPDYQAQRVALRDLHRGLEAVSPLLPKAEPAGPRARLFRAALCPADRLPALDRLCRELRLTRFDVLLSAFAWAVHAATGRGRLRVASPVANRPVAAFEDTVGMLANTMLVPVDIAEAPDLRRQLQQQAASIRAALACQDVALADLVEDLQLTGAGSANLFDAMFVLESTDYAAVALPGVAVEVAFPETVQAKCPLVLTVLDGAAGLEGVWEHQHDYVDADEAQALAGLVRQGLELLLDRPEAVLDDLVAPHRAQLPRPGEGAKAEIGFATVADGFEHQVRQTPDAIALVGRDRSFTYAQLDRMADALARELLAAHPLPAGVADGPLHVALYLDASPEHVVALLALAKLNLTAVPLDPAYPPALLRQVLDQAAPHCILLRAEQADALAPIDGCRFPRHAVTLAPDAPARPGTIARRGVRPLYTLFTSGSTGVPKGVGMFDRTLCNLIDWQRGEGGLAPAAATLQFSMLSFDVSFQEIFTTLCGGGCYHLIAPGWRQDAEALLAYLDSAGIERIFMPYAALQVVAEAAVLHGRYPSSLREVVTAGEQLLCTAAIRRWFAGMPGAVLHNHYGPTETHVVSALRLDGPAEAWPARAPIGRPVANARLLVVDDRDRPVPAGCDGRLLVAGPMVWRCYLGDAGLNRDRFVALPDPAGGTVLYHRTGDLARFDHQGLLHYLGRGDQQVKLSGHRLELGQLEAALVRHPAVVSAVAAVENDPRQLVAYLQFNGAPPAVDELDRLLAGHLPPHVRVGRYRQLAAWPTTPSGKVDRAALARAAWTELVREAAPSAALATGLERQLAELFEAVVGRPIGSDQSFFDAGATSLALMRFHLRCRAAIPAPLAMADLFEHVTIRRLARFMSGARPEEHSGGTVTRAGSRIAVIGMAVRVPGADDLDAFWSMVRDGGTGIEHFAAADGLVGARSQLRGPFDFDPGYFGISPQEARLMDPQQRHLLMACVHALEDAGIDPDVTADRIGLIASCGETTYFQSLLRQVDAADLPDGFQLALHHDKDFLATKVAFHLDLRGPAMSVQAACGSSLIATHVAAGLLRQGESDVMLAGGVLVDPLLTDGYEYRPQHIFSPDGECRPFSDEAAGTIGASGVGVVVLKPLDRALADGDRIYAVIEAAALNNDGAHKLSYTAPSIAGQAEVIRAALARAGLTGADIGYVEAHGTGTPLGDPVEVAALAKAFGPAPAGSCALASVKSQIGHLGAAAGVVGLIRAALAIHHAVVPPNPGFRRPNPRIGLERTPFYVPAESRPWPAGRRRVAGISSFGIGGTNIHLILGEAPADALPADVPQDAAPCLVLSARSREALAANIRAAEAFLARHPDRFPALLRHLQAGRRQHRWRFGAVCPAAEAARQALRDPVLRDTGAADPAGFAVAGQLPEAVLEAWIAGARIDWGTGPAPAPEACPPSLFDLDTYRFQPSRIEVHPAAGPAFPPRQPAGQWLYQQHWMRRQGLAGIAAGPPHPLLVVMVAEAADQDALDGLSAAYRRVVQVRVGLGFRRLGPDRYEADPADPDSLQQLLAALDGQAGLDWLHALPLSVTGPVSEHSLARGAWACTDTVAALLQAWDRMPDAPPLRLWLLSHQACPVEGEVARPELAALAGAVAVVPQEYPVPCHWIDLPSPGWAGLAGRLAALLSDPEAAPERMAIRGGYLWQPVFVPTPRPALAAPPALLPQDGVFLVIGGTGGIGAALCRHLLQAPGRRVVILSRTAELPGDLEPFRSRIDLVRADLGDLAAWPAVMDRLQRSHPRLDGVIHGAGTGTGSLIRARDRARMAAEMRAKTAGMLAVEALIERFRPGFVLYCSSMSALFGGAGQLDYAAANAVLDGFAQYRGPGPECPRIGIDWDIWREAGMAVAASPADPRHRAHLAVGLSTAEGVEIFDQALRLQLPQLLVSTTAIEAARQFYPSRHAGPAARPAEDVPLAGHLQASLRRWLGVEALDPDAPLYDLGADSLTMLDLVAELEKGFGVSLQLSQFGPGITLNEVLALADRDRPAAAQGWDGAVEVDVWQEGEGPDLLCLVHPVGGDVQAYRELAAALGPELRICVIADPALRRPDLPGIGVAERAALYLQALERRYPRRRHGWQLAGWSFGAWVAQAMAMAAEADGPPVPLLYLIDPPAPDSGPEWQGYSEAQIEAVFRRELAPRLPGAAGGAVPLPVQEEYAGRLTRCCRANMASMSTHRPARAARTTAHVFVATRPDPDLPVATRPVDGLRREWEALLPQLATWQMVDASHYGIVEGASARFIAAAIARNTAPVSA